ncbi:hypothetical protein MP638_004660 [Amoeboaphelidium occidentale]|nr:hypothetical protein MP638_004660 [Amoeboaphelidium occidentale]
MARKETSPTFTLKSDEETLNILAETDVETAITNNSDTSLTRQSRGSYSSSESAALYTDLDKNDHFVPYNSTPVKHTMLLVPAQPATTQNVRKIRKIPIKGILCGLCVFILFLILIVIGLYFALNGTKYEFW